MAHKIIFFLLVSFLVVGLSNSEDEVTTAGDETEGGGDVTVAGAEDGGEGETQAPPDDTGAETDAPAVSESADADDTGDGAGDATQPPETAAGTAGEVTKEEVEAATSAAAPVEDVGDKGTQAPPPADKEEATHGVEVITDAPFAPGDPCGNYTRLNGAVQHFSVSVDHHDYRTDREREEGWYGFIYNAKPAVITQEIIKPDQCGTHYSFHLEMNGNGLPGEGETTRGEICGAAATEKGILTCIESEKVDVKNCGSFYIYYLQPFKRPLLIKNRGSAVCIQDPDEIVPEKYKVQIPTPAPPKTDLPIIPIDEASDDQVDGVATVEFDYPHDPKEMNLQWKAIDKEYRQSIADKLNNLKPEKETTTAAKEDEDDTDKTEVILEDIDKVAKPDDKQEGPVVPDVDTEADPKGPGSVARRRRNLDRDYTADDVKYVGSPNIKDGSLRVSTVVAPEDGDVVPADRQVDALKSLNETGEMDDTSDMNVTAIYVGLPPDLAPPRRGAATSDDIWESHKALFIVIIILALLCLLILLIGLCCIYCRKNRGTWRRTRDGADARIETGKEPKKKPLPPTHSVESPLGDDEITKDEAPMLEKENPALTKNGGGQHISKKDEDNGWVVPYEEVKTDREVEDTRL